MYKVNSALCIKATGQWLPVGTISALVGSSEAFIAWALEHKMIEEVDGEPTQDEPDLEDIVLADYEGCCGG